jgi:hypothetical protein
VVEVKTFDYAFSAPDTILSGATTFHLVNQGPSQHHLVIFALPKGMSLATFDRLMRADSIGGTGIVIVGGAEGPADGATDAWATLDFAPGSYVLTCLLAPPTVSAGSRLVRFENAGAHSHLALVSRLAPGKTLADAAAWEMKPEGPQPFIYVGGVTAMAAGRASIARLDLEPGRYFIACVDDDGTAPKLHYEVGMVREFTVQ